MKENKEELFDTPFLDEEILRHVMHALKGEDESGSTFDARRIALTIGYISRFDLGSGNCLEIGSLDYPSANLIWSYFKPNTLQSTSVDLRFDSLPIPNNSIDSVICTEVIEHISDRWYMEATTLDGLFFFLSEVLRVLKVGGRALITTPNAASLWSIMRILEGNAPLMYDWHFREYSMTELEKIVKSSGFRIIHHRSEYSWHLWDFTDIINFIESSQFSIDNRGDDQFLVIEKPENICYEPNDLNLPGTLTQPPRFETLVNRVRSSINIRRE